MHAGRHFQDVDPLTANFKRKLRTIGSEFWQTMMPKFAAKIERTDGIMERNRLLVLFIKFCEKKMFL